MVQENELESLRNDYEQVRKDNFKLKQSLMRTEERLKMLEMKNNKGGIVNMVIITKRYCFFVSLFYQKANKCKYFAQWH